MSTDSLTPAGQAQRISELEADLRECMAGNAQARQICDAVAAELGNDLDRDTGSAASVRRLKERLTAAHQEVLQARLQARPVRYTYASTVTPAERAYAHRTALYKMGDMRLVWANEGDLLGHTQLPAPANSSSVPVEDPAALAAEVARLTAALKQANAQAEEFERKYYLETHKVEDLEARLAEQADVPPPDAYLIECRLHMSGIIRVRSDEDVELAKAHGEKAVPLYRGKVVFRKPDPAELACAAAKGRADTLREVLGLLDAQTVPRATCAASEMAARRARELLVEVREKLQSRLHGAPGVAQRQPGGNCTGAACNATTAPAPSPI